MSWKELATSSRAPPRSAQSPMARIIGESCSGKTAPYLCHFLPSRLGLRKPAGARKRQGYIVASVPARCKAKSSHALQQARPFPGPPQSSILADGKHTFHRLAAGEGLAQGAVLSNGQGTAESGKALDRLQELRYSTLVREAPPPSIPGGPQPGDLHSGGSIQRVTC